MWTVNLYKSIKILLIIPSSQLDDENRFGRYVVVAHSTILYMILANILHWVPNYSGKLFLRLIMGYCDAGFILTGFTLG